MTSTAHNTLYSAPFRRHPVGQPIVFGDLGSGAVTANLGSHSGVTNLYGLPAPVYAGTVPVGVSSTVPTAAVCTRSALASRVDKSGSETALRDQRLANYEARLSQEGLVSPVPNAMAGASIPCGAGHSQVTQPRANDTCNPLQMGESVSLWTRHKERAHNLSAYGEQLPVESHYVGEGIPRINARSVPRCEETSDDDNYQPGFRAQSHYRACELGLAHPDVPRGCQERLSRRDWYETSARPAPAPLRRQEEFGVPRQPLVDWGPARPYPQVCLAQMQDFQGDGSVTLNMFSNQVDELSRFYHWDEQETCHQARAHLRGTVLAYVRHAPFPPCTWEEIKTKTLLMKCLQSRDLTVTYKAQFWSCHRCQTEDIYTYVETFHRLVDLAWPFMDYHAKQEMVIDQFLFGMGN